MIVWNSFLSYFLLTGDKVKLYTFSILAMALLLRRREIVLQSFNWLSKISTRKLLVSLMGLALLVRMAWIVWSPHTQPAAGVEDHIILRHARELAAGEGYRSVRGTFTADRPIGYALWLAMFFKIFGENIFLLDIIHVLLGCLTVGLVFKIGNQVSNRVVGFIAGLTLAIYPSSIMATKLILEEHFFIPMWLGGIALLISDFKKPYWAKAISAGLIFGIAAHFRTYAIAMGVVAFCFWFFGKKGIWQATTRFLVIQLLLLVCAAPWAVRNYFRLGEPIFYTTWIGASLYYSNNSTADVRYPVNPAFVSDGGDPDFLTLTENHTELDWNRAGKKAAMKWIAENPSIFIQKAIGRIIYFLGINREGWTVLANFSSIKKDRKLPHEKMIRYFDKWDNDYYGTVFLLALFGSFVSWFQNKKSIKKKSFGCIFWALASYLSIVALTLGHRKYRLPIEPLFCILAGYGFFYMWFGTVFDRLKSRERGSVLV